MFDHLASAMQGLTVSDDVDDDDDDERLDCPKAWPLSTPLRNYGDELRNQPRIDGLHGRGAERATEDFFV